MHELTDLRVAVLGLGYVGLPLALEFAKHYRVVGYDINGNRVQELAEGRDRTLEVSADDLRAAVNLTVTADPEALRHVTAFIVTAPTPVDAYKQPDLRPVLSASAEVGRALKKGDTVIYESTVYPGATEEMCVPALERESGFIFNKDFTVGYSPERINPGDSQHRLASIIKVTSGSTPEAADFVDALYGSVITAGTHRASSIKVAEAAKVIENTQRDVNIALINELAILFNRLGIDTREVLEVAGSKWNFMRFWPGLVGGHCIGVDPYYLTHKAQSVGYNPEMILAGRRINDSMGVFVATQVIKLLSKRGVSTNGARVLILGLTFKENTPDLRNSKVPDVVRELQDYGVSVDVFDPWVDAADAWEHLGVMTVSDPQKGQYDGVVLAVAHEDFATDRGFKAREFLTGDAGVVYDVKGVLPRSDVDLRL